MHSKQRQEEPFGKKNICIIFRHFHVINILGDGCISKKQSQKLQLSFSGLCWVCNLFAITFSTLLLWGGES